MKVSVIEEHGKTPHRGGDKLELSTDTTEILVVHNPNGSLTVIAGSGSMILVESGRARPAVVIRPTT